MSTTMGCGLLMLYALIMLGFWAGVAFVVLHFLLRFW